MDECVIDLGGHQVWIGDRVVSLEFACQLRDWLNAHLPEHPAVPADAFDDMETAR